MSGEAAMMLLIALFAAVFQIVKQIRSIPVPPDPWEPEISSSELAQSDMPICVKCLTPVTNPDQHYCPVCGHVTGLYTRYIPYVNIPFNCSLYVTLWKKLKDTDSKLSTMAVALVVILFGAPVMLIVVLPMLLYDQLKAKPNRQPPGTLPSS